MNVKPDDLSKQLMRAFVQGAKWWQFYSQDSTMWQSDQELAWKEAAKRLYDGTLGEPNKTEAIMEREDEARTKNPA